MSASVVLGVPAVHQHDRHAHRGRCRQRERERRGVVQRTGAQVDVLSRRRSASAARASALARLSVLRRTPFGRPVVPDV